MGFWMTVFAVWVGVIFAFLSMGLLFVVFLFSTSREEKEERDEPFPREGQKEGPGTREDK